jgi:uncharacterized protein YceK
MGMFARMLTIVAAAALLMSGCRTATLRANARAESHLKFHTARALKCDEKKLTTECIEAFKSGECYDYEVSGCDASIRYRNLSGQGWEPES